MKNFPESEIKVCIQESYEDGNRQISYSESDQQVSEKVQILDDVITICGTSS